MPRYFFGENAGRPVQVGAKRYAFDIIAVVGGTQQGVVAVPDEEADDFLKVAAKWVSEISAEEYASSLQKKKTTRPLRDSAAPGPLGPPLKGRGAVVVDGRDAPQPGSKVKELPATIDDAISVGRADAPAADAGSKVRESKRQNHREKRGLE